MDALTSFLSDSGLGPIIFVLLAVLLLALSACLIIAPLMIWSWCKRTALQIEALRRQLEAQSKRETAYQAQVSADLRIIRDAMRQ